MYDEEIFLAPIDVFTDIMVRLFNGSTASEGRVEVFHNGYWGTICQDNFTSKDARVICNMLGYKDS
jgi:deleted-in-malignant-brain-tumors protein 1